MARSQSIPRPSRDRSTWLLGGLLAGFAVIFLRLFWLQVVRQDYYGERWAQKIAIKRSAALDPTPGRILSANGDVLARSAPMYMLVADPARMLKLNRTTFAQCAAKVAPLIGRTPQAVEADLTSHSGKGYVKLSAWLRQDTAQTLRDLKIEGLSTERVWLRKYPLGKAACHVLGGRDRYHHALGGLEFQYRALLDGEPGVGGTAAVAPGLEGLNTGSASLPPVPGRDLVLTLDSNLQRQVEAEMDRLWAQETPRWCTCVVEEIKTGALLALSSRPNYDPGAFAAIGTAGQKGPSVASGSTTNWPVTAEVEQGSTFKIILAAAALSSGRVSPNRTFVCNGHLGLGGQPIGCWGKYAAHGHGRLDMAGMLANSCNLCAAQTALAIGKEYYRDFLARCGIGQDPQAGFPGEALGFLARPANIRPRDLGTMAFGQNVSCSSLQLTSIVAGLMNDGKMMHPHIVSKVLNKDRSLFREEPTTVERTLCTPEVSAQLRTMLEGVVTNGTGRAAAIPGVRVGGKTGTAQQWDPVLHRHTQDRYLVSFIMVFPIDQPRYIIHVACYEPHRGQHGADVAAPVCQRIGKYILQQIDRQTMASPAVVAPTSKPASQPLPVASPATPSPTAPKAKVKPAASSLD